MNCCPYVAAIVAMLVLLPTVAVRQRDQSAAASVPTSRVVDAAKAFYANALGLPVDEDNPGHHSKLGIGDRFICLERKGLEDYPSADKAVLFLTVLDVRAAVERIDAAFVLRCEIAAAKPWAAVQDPEGHTIVLTQ